MSNNFKEIILSIYPFEKSKIPNNKRITSDFVNENYKKCKDMLFPHVISNNIGIIAGCSKNEWVDLYESMTINCKLFGLTEMHFIWDMEIFIFEVDLELLQTKPDNFRTYLINKYTIGFGIALLDTPYNSLDTYSIANTAIQMYVSPPTVQYDNEKSFKIPGLTAANKSCISIINEKNLKCYCHSSLMLNISNINMGKYVGDLLSYCSSHGFEGVVFHCGKRVKKTEEDAINQMTCNILDAFKQNPYISSKFLLENPAGQGTELFSSIFDFLDYVEYLNEFEEINGQLGICVDTCHAFATGYDPYIYLKECHSRVPVSLVHFNDSLHEFNSKKDRHECPNKGKIPYQCLDKVAEFCTENNIDMVFEC